MAGKSHIGKAGHLAAMAEFLLRGYNVAMPEVVTAGRLQRISVQCRAFCNGTSCAYPV